MIHVHLRNRYGRRWTWVGSCAVNGYAFWQGSLLTDDSLADWFARPGVRVDLAQSVRSANGSFQVVYQEPDRLWAAVDHLRSLPLFYAVKGSEFYLSDDAYWVREATGDTTLDVVSVAEFHSPGYVTGPETLSPTVKQLQAGECLEVQAGPAGVDVKAIRYYRYLHRDPVDESVDTFGARHAELMDAVARRLIDSVHGRTVVIPLSGGYDSRLVALLLKTHGYDRVICFSYGRPNNAESAISRQVAERLGYPWFFVPYSNAMWREVLQSGERLAHDRFADNLVSLPHLQDWPAVRQLQHEGTLPDDSIFAPGHSGDFLAGSHMLAHRAWVQDGRADDMVRAIEHEHYHSYREAAPPGRDLWPQAAEKILSAAADRIDGTVESVLGACDTWDWQERQAKFIVNAARVYEFFGYEWRVPLWDTAMMALWERVPLDLDRPALYETYVRRQGAPFGLESTVSKVRRHRVLVKAAFRGLRLEFLGRRLKNMSEIRNDPFAISGVIPPEQRWAYGSFYNPAHIYLARKRLSEIQSELRGTAVAP